MSDTTNAGDAYTRRYLCNVGFHPDLAERIMAAPYDYEGTDPLLQRLDRRLVDAIQTMGALKDCLYDIEHEPPPSPGGV